MCCLLYFVRCSDVGVGCLVYVVCCVLRVCCVLCVVRRLLLSFDGRCVALVVWCL